VLAGKTFREGPVRPVDWVVFVMDVIPYLKRDKNFGWFVRWHMVSDRFLKVFRSS
jgi:hypothetical protein